MTGPRRRATRAAGELVHNERGVAMVEFAIILPLLVLFIGGIIEFGRAYKLYNNLAAAVRDGARFGAAQIPPTPAQIVTRVQTAFTAAAGSSHPAPTVAVTLSGTQVVVTVTGYPYDPITPFVPAQSIAFTAEATFRREDVP